MIVSASRRTDIPAFYGQWFLNRLKAGWCDVPNPFNPGSISRVSLRPDDVSCFVFWTKNVAPFEPVLDVLDARALPYVFLFTLNDYPETLEPGVPDVTARLQSFRRLGNRIGPDRLRWRYDPILLSRHYTSDWHLEHFARLCEALASSTCRVIVSFADFYRKTERRLSAVETVTDDRFVRDPFLLPGFADFAGELSRTAVKVGLTIQSCCEHASVAAAGIPEGACIDPAWIEASLGIRVTSKRHRGQRPACRCVVSRDIGVTNTCLHGCEYCYATVSQRTAETRSAVHDPNASQLA